MKTYDTAPLPILLYGKCESYSKTILTIVQNLLTGTFFFSKRDRSGYKFYMNKLGAMERVAKGASGIENLTQEAGSRAQQHEQVYVYYLRAMQASSSQLTA